MGVALQVRTDLKRMLGRGGNRRFGFVFWFWPKSNYALPVKRSDAIGQGFCTALLSRLSVTFAVLSCMPSDRSHDAFTGMKRVPGP